jgi:putative tryptophan/tyrosine transport system substrate-binding protein
VRRREFITHLGGAAAWPVAARAQQGERMRRIAVLMPLAADDAIAQARNAAFLQGLQQLGWTIGQNIQIEYRWSGGNDEVTRRYAAELAALAPEVIFASGSAATGRYCRRRARCRSCSWPWPTRSAPASSIAWRGRAATPPVSSCSNTV